jgi:hypothetical protein
VLVRELGSYRAKPVLVAADTPLAWREGAHDDLVLAVALAAWAGESWIEPYAGPLCYNVPWPGDEPDEPARQKPHFVRVLEDLGIDLEEDW